MILDSKGEEITTSRMGFVPSQPVRKTAQDVKVILTNAVSSHYLELTERGGD